MSGHPSYPWSQGDALFADELNAAIANSGQPGGPFLPITGALPLTGPMTVGTGTGTPSLTLNGAAGTNKGLNWLNAGTTRWRMITDASDNLALHAYDASGGYLNAAVTFQQSDMTAWFNFKLATNITNATPPNSFTGINISATNTGPNPASGNKFTYLSAAGGGGFDCGIVNIATFNTNFAAGAANPAQQGEWRVTISPNDATHFFGTNCAEWNIVNRGPDVGWMRDRGSGRNPTGGLLIVPELASFDPIAGGEGTSVTYGFSTAAGGGANSHGVVPRFYNNYLVEPNSTVGQTGRAIYVTGDITTVPAAFPYGPMQTDGIWLHGFDHTLAVYQDNNAQVMKAGQGVAWLTGTTGTPTNICRDTAGSGSPEGVVTANKGSTYRRFDGGAASCFYVKESGTGNTGWVAK